jgi:hypothetical protein
MYTNIKAGAVKLNQASTKPSKTLSNLRTINRSSYLNNDLKSKALLLNQLTLSLTQLFQTVRNTKTSLKTLCSTTTLASAPKLSLSVRKKASPELRLRSLFTKNSMEPAVYWTVLMQRLQFISLLGLTARSINRFWRTYTQLTRSAKSLQALSSFITPRKNTI